MTQQLDHRTVAHGMQPEDTPELRALYQGFKENHLNPLWTVPSQSSVWPRVKLAQLGVKPQDWHRS